MSYKTVEVLGVKATYEEDIPEEEVKAYVERAKKRFGNALRSIDIEIDHCDKDFVNLTYDTSRVPFQRLRRITGYLVGDMSRWNDAKRAEEHDRVKHDV